MFYIFKIDSKDHLDLLIPNQQLQAKTFTFWSWWLELRTMISIIFTTLSITFTILSITFKMLYIAFTMLPISFMMLSIIFTMLYITSDGHTFVYSLLRYRYCYIVSNGRY
jgi:hypothetical protein